MPGKWIARAGQRRSLDKLILDRNSPVSETYGRREQPSSLAALERSGVPARVQGLVICHEPADRVCYLSSVDAKSSIVDRALVKNDPRKQYGHIIRSLRQKAGYSQESLAELSGLHRTYVGAVERGERNVSLLNIVALARALDISVSRTLRGIS